MLLNFMFINTQTMSRGFLDYTSSFVCLCLLPMKFYNYEYSRSVVPRNRDRNRNPFDSHGINIECFEIRPEPREEQAWPAEADTCAIDFFSLNLHWASMVGRVPIHSHGSIWHMCLCFCFQSSWQPTLRKNLWEYFHHQDRFRIRFCCLI